MEKREKRRRQIVVRQIAHQRGPRSWPETIEPLWLHGLRITEFGSSNEPKVKSGKLAN